MIYGIIDAVEFVTGVFVMLYLSKSLYCGTVQCPKILWMRKNIPDRYDDSVLNEAALSMGNEVGDLAMGLFGEFREVPYVEGDLTPMINMTREWLAEGVPVIAEASFVHDGAFCSVDILVNKGGGDVELYEVKSTTHVKDIHYHDVAYQYHVLESVGLRVGKACIVNVNNKYTRRGALDLHELFVINDVTERIREMQPGVAAQVDMLKKYMKQQEEPEHEIGEHCFSPYDCGYFGWCSRALPKPNVFDLSGMQLRTKMKHFRNGVVSFAQLEAEKSVKGNYRLQIEHELYDVPDSVDAGEIRKFTETLSFPLYFLDFESFQPAVPLYDGTRPFQQIVFQYSLHYILREGGEAGHREFLAYPGDDPRRALAERLCEDIPAGACVTAYNMTFEKSRIKELAGLYPDLAEHLMSIHDNIVDLMVPFRNKWYYNRAMQGSYSVKYVLPALFPDDPALDYHNLDGVHNGAEASAAFENMARMDAAELEKYREHLLRYCELDTLALVKIWEKLTDAAAGR